VYSMSSTRPLEGMKSRCLIRQKDVSDNFALCTGELCYMLYSHSRVFEALSWMWYYHAIRTFSCRHSNYMFFMLIHLVYVIIYIIGVSAVNMLILLFISLFGVCCCKCTTFFQSGQNLFLVPFVFEIILVPKSQRKCTIIC